jgi:hypothetical protein
MEDIDAIRGLGDQAPTETKPLRRPSPYGDQAPTETKPLRRPSPYGDQAPTETKPLHYQSPSLFLKIGITCIDLSKKNFPYTPWCLSP